jgi:hypothetical protein
LGIGFIWLRTGKGERGHDLSDFIKGGIFLMSFEVFSAMEMHVVVFWVMTPCDVVVGYHPEDVGSVALRNFGFNHNVTRGHSPENLDF